MTGYRLSAAENRQLTTDNSLRFRGRDHQLHPSILQPARCGLVRRYRVCLSLTGRTDAIGGEAGAHEIVADGVCTLLGERHVLLVAPDAVGMSLDRDADVAVAFQLLGDLREGVLR